MEIEKTDRINKLLDFYQNLLTNKQREYITLYFSDDYSLGEISEEFDVSRQAVFDNIKRTTKLLEKYEIKLHLLANYESRNQKFDKIKEYILKSYPTDQKLVKLLSDLTRSEEE